MNEIVRLSNKMIWWSMYTIQLREWMYVRLCRYLVLQLFLTVYAEGTYEIVWDAIS